MSVILPEIRDIITQYLVVQTGDTANLCKNEDVFVAFKYAICEHPHTHSHINIHTYLCINNKIHFINNR